MALERGTGRAFPLHSSCVDEKVSQPTIQVHREDRATRVGTIGEELGRTGPHHEGLYLAEGLSAVADARCRHFPRGCRLSSEYIITLYR